MPQPREIASVDRQPPFSGAVGQTPEDPFAKLESLGIPRSILFQEVKVDDWGVEEKTGLALLIPAAEAAVVIAVAKAGLSGDGKRPDDVEAGAPTDQPQDKGPIRFTRRGFLKAATATGGGLVLAACLPGEQQKSSETPTPAFSLTPELVASLKKDSSFKNERDWVVTTFEPQLKALINQFDRPTIESMYMGVTGIPSPDKEGKFDGYVTELRHNQDKYTYFGADKQGRGGVWVSVPSEARVHTLSDGSTLALPTRRPDYFIYRYIDDKGNVLDPSTGMMVGTNVPEDVLDKVEGFYLGISDKLAALVKTRVLKDKDTKAQFYIKVRYDEKDNEFYGVIEEKNSKGEYIIYRVTKGGNIQRLEPVKGSYYRLNKQTGEVEIYKQDDNAPQGILDKALKVVTFTPTATLFSSPTPVATAILTPISSPTATVAPTETLLHLGQVELSTEVAGKFIAGGEFAEIRGQYKGRIFTDSKSGATILLSPKAKESLKTAVLSPEQLSSSDWTKILEKNNFKLRKGDFVVFDEGGRIWIFRETIDKSRGGLVNYATLLTSDGSITFNVPIRKGGNSVFLTLTWSDEFGLVRYIGTSYNLITAYSTVDSKTDQWGWYEFDFPIETNPADRALQREFTDWANKSIDQRKDMVVRWFDSLVAKNRVVFFSPEQIEKLRKYSVLLAYLNPSHPYPTKLVDGKTITYPKLPVEMQQVMFSYMKLIMNNSGKGHFAEVPSLGMNLDTNDGAQSPEIERYIKWWSVILKEAYTNQIFIAGGSPTMAVSQLSHFNYLDRLGIMGGIIFLEDVRDSNDPLISDGVKRNINERLGSYYGYLQEASQYAK